MVSGEAIQQRRFAWPNNASVAVSLTYDDALECHYESVAPLLEANGLHGTFYLPINSIQVDDIGGWRSVAAGGHELGNHSVFHPCRKGPGMEWLDDCYDLRHYTLSQLESELSVANLVLELIDGKQFRTYGNCCCDTTVGVGDNEVSMIPVLEKHFRAARGALIDEPVNPRNPDYYSLGHFSADNRTCESIRAEIESAFEIGGWLIYMIHGVGEETHAFTIDETEHEKLVLWLAKHEMVWTAPLLEVATHIRRQLP